MAAYAALVSLLNNMEQIRNHPHFSTSFNKEQMESLLHRVDFLFNFLESQNSSSEELEKEIASAAHAAEDVIEFYIVRLIRIVKLYNVERGKEDADYAMTQIARAAEGEVESVGNWSSLYMQPAKFKLHRLKVDLLKIMEDMDSVREKVMKLKEEELPKSAMAAASSRTLTDEKSNMTQLLEELTGHQSDRRIILLAGMRERGETTLARNAYDSLLVVQHFDVRAWVTVSQTYNVREILLEILSCVGKSNNGMDNYTERELRKRLCETLSDMRYLIVLDDMWSIEVWDMINFVFPNNCSSSRILVTTRISDAASHFGFMARRAHAFVLREKALSKEIGMEIVKKHQRNLPSIVMIGGHHPLSSQMESFLQRFVMTGGHHLSSTSFDKEQMESLLQRVDFLLDFIESHSSYGGSKEEAEELEKQITSVAHAAEVLIESQIALLIRIVQFYNDKKNKEDADYSVSQIADEAQAAEDEVEFVGNWSSFYMQSVKINVKVDLWKIMGDMDSIIEKVMKVKEEKGSNVELLESPMPAASSRPLTTGESNMVGFDGYLTQLLEELTGYQSDRKIIPIVGMGGIGKTTLARNAYDNLLVVHHFDVRAWVTISQRYNVRGILLETLSCLTQSNNGMDAKTEHELGEQLHKTLSGMRYLIILDDMWSIEVWDEIKVFFPNNCCRSRIIVTTRISDVANHFGSIGLALDFPDDDHSWKLFCEKVFPEEACPFELKESRMKIVEKCKGLPLSMVVIGGLLRNSSRTQGQWENVERDMRSLLNTAEDNRCLKLLSLSFSHLPACLKPCFLYLAIFSEDDVISVSRVIKLWVAEGFIKPNKDQSLEEIAEGCIKDLVGRNLIYVHSLRWNRKFKTFRIHDLLRDLCIKVARKEEFVCDTSVLDAPQEILSWRRHIFTPLSKQILRWRHVSEISLARSLLCKSMPWGEPRLLRVLIAESRHELSFYFNLRCFAYESMAAHIVSVSTYHLPSSISLLWNLQTLIMTGGHDGVVALPEIWKMPQLRHLKFRTIILPDPPPSDGSVLHNLQTLGRVVDFKCSKEVCDRMPNIKKLHVYYGDFSRGAETLSYYCIHNVILLHNLESLHIGFGQQPMRDNLLQSLMLPNSLKKLTLECCQLEWSDMRIFGSLPHLEALKLKFAVSGPNWDLDEVKFLRLKYLRIHFSNLISWNADDTHFPLLADLVLERCHSLDEIPSGIGDIPTLERICLVDCSISATLSAIRILEEQECMGNEGLQVKVHFRYKSKLEEFRKQVNQEGLKDVKFQLKGV